jgi:uncharacterized protein YggE
MCKSQTSTNPYAVRTIEVTGTAEKEVIPDEMYISITLMERYDNKEKITIEKQEKDLINALSTLGINMADLTLADANADYIKIHKREKDVISKREYMLKVKDAVMVGRVFEKLDEVKIFDSYISRIDHSKMEELKRNTRIEAVKAAKEKATYLLSALSEAPGRALRVTENSYPMYEANVNLRSMAGNYAMSKDGMDEQAPLEFKKIKIESSVNIVFEIK